MADSEKLVSSLNTNMTCWSVPNQDQLIWLGWDGFYMVFHPASGEMHLLDALSREIVDLIAETPCSDRDLLAEMEKIFDRELSPDLNEKIMGSLAELDKIGLIEPINSAAANI